MFERIYDRPRIVFPGPSYVQLSAGVRTSVIILPQIPARAPYWFGMTAFEELEIVELLIKGVSVFGTQGGAPSTFWDARHPEKLIPFRADDIGPGSVVHVTIFNSSCASMTTSMALWATPFDSPKTAMTGVSGGGFVTTSVYGGGGGGFATTGVSGSGGRGGAGSGSGSTMPAPSDVSSDVETPKKYWR